MKKGLAVAATLLAATILGLPWALGSRAQTVYDNALAQLQEQGVGVLDSRYRRGWFTSDASVAIEVPQSPSQTQGAAVVPLRLESQVAHGPWTYGSLRLLPSAALIESRLVFLVSGLEPIALWLTTRVELDGGGVMRVRLPEISIHGAALGMAGADGSGELKFSPGFSSAAGWFEMPSLSLSTSKGVIRGRFSVVSQGLTTSEQPRPGGWIERLAGEGELILPRPQLLLLLEDWQQRQVLKQLQQDEVRSPTLPEGLENVVSTAAREQLDSLVRQGWLAEKDDNLKVAFRLEDTLLTLNGKSIPIGAAVPVP